MRRQTGVDVAGRQRPGQGGLQGARDGGQAAPNQMALGGAPWKRQGIGVPCMPKGHRVRRVATTSSHARMQPPGPFTSGCLYRSWIRVTSGGQQEEKELRGAQGMRVERKQQGDGGTRERRVHRTQDTSTGIGWMGEAEVESERSPCGTNAQKGWERRGALRGWSRPRQGCRTKRRQRVLVGRAGNKGRGEDDGVD